MKKILKKHKKLNIDFYLYGFVFFSSLNRVTTKKKGKKRVVENSFSFQDSKTDVYYCGKNIIWRIEEKTNTEKETTEKLYFKIVTKYFHY